MIGSLLGDARLEAPLGWQPKPVDDIYCSIASSESLHLWPTIISKSRNEFSLRAQMNHRTQIELLPTPYGQPQVIAYFWDVPGGSRVRLLQRLFVLPVNTART